MIHQYTFGNYVFDSEHGLVFNGASVHLPPKERALLKVLLGARGQVVRKEDLIGVVWAGQDASDESVSRTVYRLRVVMQKSGGPDVIETVYNMGFRLRVPVRVSRIEHATALGTMRLSHRPRAVTALMSAREFLARQSAADIELAAQATRIAITLDPHFSAAWATLAEIRICQAIRSLRPPREAGWLARQAADTALESDPDSAAATACRGWVIAMVEQDVPRGLKDLDRAIELDPEYWGSFVWRAWVLQAARRSGDAVLMIQRATELNPLGHGIHALLAQFQWLAGDLDAAQASARELADRFATLDSAQAIACEVLGGCGRLDEAIGFGQRAAALQAPPALLAPLAYAYAASGQESLARQCLQAIENAPLPTPSAALAPVYLALGDAATAEARLLDAWERGIPQLAWCRDDPRLGEVRNRPTLRPLWASIAPPAPAPA